VKRWNKKKVSVGPGGTKRNEDCRQCYGRNVEYCVTVGCGSITRLIAQYCLVGSGTGLPTYTIRQLILF